MKPNAPISVLHERLVYDPETGNLRWRIPPCKPSADGFAGCLVKIERNTYRVITLNQKIYYAHRIVWAMVRGYWPVGVDHEDGNGLNNRIDNLREANEVDNGRNRSRSKANTSGTTGVIWIKPTQRWRAGIKVNGVYHSLGSFVDINEAVRVRKEAEVRFGFHPNHDR